MSAFLQGKQQQKVVEGFRLMLQGLGVDISSPHLRDTPERAARAWIEELCVGLTQKEPEITTFQSDVDEMVILRHIPIRSLCAHHLLPFFGEASIAYIPGSKKILGISKLSRIADHWARRPQVQEELTCQIADHIARLVISTSKPHQHSVSTHISECVGGVGVLIRARHMCMELRGVQHAGDLTTSALRGVLLTKPEARAEFLRLAAPATIREC